MRPAVPLALALLLTSACGDPTGAVEFAWAFVDRDGDPIFPGGVFSVEDERDTCDLPGSANGQDVTYDLRVELSICDLGCAAGCDDEQCLVLPSKTFPCNTARGNEPEVPSAEDPYRFIVRAVISAPSIGQDQCRDAAPTCLAIPAPRERTVEAGLVTDLQVYQITVDVDRTQPGDRLDLGACGCA